MGRDPTCGVYLNTPRVSRRHAVLLAIGNGSYKVADAASRNGVYVRGQRVDRAEVTVGDVFSLGQDVVLMVTRAPQYAPQVRREDRLVAIGRVVQTIAHDLRNTIGTVTTVAGYLETHPAAEEHPDVAQCAQELNAAADAGLQLLQHLAAFADGRVEPHEQVLVATIFDSLERLIRRGLPTGVRLHMKVSRPDLEVTADENQLVQALLNLCRNAIDAMSATGELRVSCVRLPRNSPLTRDNPKLRAVPWLLFEVSDTGHGMSAATLARIFEPFFTTKGHGTGIGLPSVHGTVRQHGGHIDVESHQGVGTTFRIFLPATPSNADGEESSGLLENATTYVAD